MTTVVALPGPLRPELRDSLLALYRGWVRTGRAELPGAAAAAGRAQGQNIRSDLDTSEKTKSVPPPLPT